MGELIVQPRTGLGISQKHSWRTERAGPEGPTMTNLTCQTDWRNMSGGEDRGQSPLAEGSPCSLVSPVWPSTGRAP